MFPPAPPDDVDASYAAYDKDPLDKPDEWGDLASFLEAVASSPPSPHVP